jgi:Tfp pilus assembly protein PilE
MKKKIVIALLAVIATTSFVGGLTETQAKAVESSNYVLDNQGNKQEEFSVKFIRADYYDKSKEHTQEFQGNALEGSTINFTAEVTGGVGKITYEYFVTGRRPNSSYNTPLSTSSNFTWMPKIWGNYRVEVVAYDELGHTASVGYLYSIGR